MHQRPNQQVAKSPLTALRVLRLGQGGAAFIRAALNNGKTYAAFVKKNK